MLRMVAMWCVASGLALALSLGEVPKEVVLDGKKGGKVSGGAWSSKSLKGKVHALFYVDPDKKDLNEAFANTLKKKNYDASKAASVAVINMASTWKPDFIIESILKKKQKKYPRALYVKDKKKVLVKEWGLADDNYNVLIFDKKGKLIYKKAGKMSKTEIDKAIALIDKHL